MKPFNQQAALDGAPVLLKAGLKGYIKFSLPEPNSHSHPFIGYCLDERGFSRHHLLTWDNTGENEDDEDFDIIEMWEEPANTTQTFKFGDRVRIRGGMAIYIFIKKQGANDAVVIYESEINPVILPMNHLEIIPHPDTERLDWFEENVNSLETSSLTDMTGDVMSFIELAQIDTGGRKKIYPMPEDHYASLREYIDAAMQSE